MDVNGRYNWHADFLMDDFMGQWKLWNNYMIMNMVIKINLVPNIDS